MKKEKIIKVKLITLILLSIVIIIGVMVFMFFLNNIRKNEIIPEKNSEVESLAFENVANIENLENNNSVVNNVKKDDSIPQNITNNVEIEQIEANDKNDYTDENIKEYNLNELIYIIYAHNFCNNAIDEFDSIEDATQEYLFAVATNSLVYNRKDKDLYNLKYEDFNYELVRIFGEKADKLLKKENIYDSEFDYDADTGIYSIIGRGLAENDIKSFIITDVKQNENNYNVTIYEYIWKAVDDLGHLIYINDATNVWICGRDEEKLIEFEAKNEEYIDDDGRYYVNNIYDENGNLIEDMEEYLKQHSNLLKDKRVINVEYDEEKDKYIVISNKIIR